MLVSAIGILVLLGAQSAFASTDLPSAKDPQAAYKSGFQHGVADAKAGCNHPDACHWYILQRGKSFAFHTKEFNFGYTAAMCKAGISSDANQATWSCPY